MVDRTEKERALLEDQIETLQAEIERLKDEAKAAKPFTTDKSAGEEVRKVADNIAPLQARIAELEQQLQGLPAAPAEPLTRDQAKELEVATDIVNTLEHFAMMTLVVPPHVFLRVMRDSAKRKGRDLKFEMHDAAGFWKMALEWLQELKSMMEMMERK